MSEPEVDGERGEAIEREWEKMTGGKVDLEEHITELKNQYLEKQADEILQKLLGFRCSRRWWDNMDLYAKDEEKANKETPGTRRKGWLMIGARSGVTICHFGEVLFTTSERTARKPWIAYTCIRPRHNSARDAVRQQSLSLGNQAPQTS